MRLAPAGKTTLPKAVKSKKLNGLPLMGLADPLAGSVTVKLSTGLFEVFAAPRRTVLLSREPASADPGDQVFVAETEYAAGTTPFTTGAFAVCVAALSALIVAVFVTVVLSGVPAGNFTVTTAVADVPFGNPVPPPVRA